MTTETRPDIGAYGSHRAPRSVRNDEEQLDSDTGQGEVSPKPRKVVESQPLRSNFADDSHWIALARKKGVRLPRATTINTPGRMEHWLRKLGVSRRQYLDFSGEKSLRDFPAANPTWPLRAWVGILLEWIVPADDIESDGR